MLLAAWENKELFMMLGFLKKEIKPWMRYIAILIQLVYLFFLNISLINVDPNCCRKLIKYMALYLSFNLGCR